MERSLNIHKSLVNRKGHRVKRSTELIAKFDNGYAGNWRFCVPLFFCEALDIKLTERVVNNKKVNVLTQGSNYNLVAGDTFYNHAYAYCQDFYCAHHTDEMKICIQIQSATPCIPASKNNKRNPGSVNFKILINREENQSGCTWETIGIKTLNQDEFIELLIKGIPSEWTNRKSEAQEKPDSNSKMRDGSQPNLW